MEENLFSFKDLYQCYLKATYPIEVGNRTIEPGETIIKFDRVQLAGLSNLVTYVTAHGGWDDRAHVFWETTKEERLTLAQGVFSKEHFALLYNAKFLEETGSTLITTSENLEINEDSQVTLQEVPEQFFIYKKDDFTKLEASLDNKTLTFTNVEPYTDVIVDYTYTYPNKSYRIQVGNQLISGFLSLEARTRVKDDTTGQVVTGIIKIPKLKLMSDLSITLGAQASPIVANLKAMGVPVGAKGNSYVMEYTFLSNDLDSDM